MTIKLYANTGFDSINIPDSYDLLDEMSSFIIHTEEDVDILQTDYLATVRVTDVPPQQARQVDYAIVEDDEAVVGFSKTAYSVQSFRMLNAEVCEFQLLIDPFVTFGGLKLATSGNLILSGSAKRLSVKLTDDAANYYTLPEPFEPAERFITSFGRLDNNNNESYNFLESITVPPRWVKNPMVDESDYTVKTAAGNLTSDSKCFEQIDVGCTTVSSGSGTNKSLSYTRMILPKSRPVKSTQYGIGTPEGSSYTITIGTRWWENTEAKNAPGLIQDFRDCGRDNDLINCWEVPKEYVNTFTSGTYDSTSDATSVMGIAGISSTVQTPTVNLTPITVYNNKAKYCQANIIKVYSPCSGQSIDKNPYEIAESMTPASTTIAAIGVITADIRPQGCPMFCWKRMNGTDARAYVPETISGANWRSVPLAAEGASNINLERLNLETQQTQENRSLIGGVVSGVVGTGIAAVGSIMSGGTATPAAIALGAGIAAAGTAASSGIKAFMNATKHEEQRRLLEARSINASVQINIGDMGTARECYKNGFFYILSSYGTNDMAAYDTFLTKYGYNVGNMPITNEDFYTRPAFNFVQINDIDIQSNRYGMDMITKVKEQLKAGVRIWHKQPEVADMLASGNR